MPIRIDTLRSAAARPKAVFPRTFQVIMSVNIWIKRKQCKFIGKYFSATVLLLVTIVSDCYAETKHPLLIKGIGLGQVKRPCTPKPVKFFSSYDGSLEKILLKCSLEKDHDSIEITFSSDGKRVVRVLRTQSLTENDPTPSDVFYAAIKFYGKPVETRFDSFAIYGDAHYCNDCKTDLKTNNSGTGLAICMTYGWHIANRRYFSAGDKGIVYELVDMPGLLKAHADGEKSAQTHNEKMLSKLKF